MKKIDYYYWKVREGKVVHIDLGQELNNIRTRTGAPSKKHSTKSLISTRQTKYIERPPSLAQERASRCSKIWDFD
jgi:hypothetical protein